jgi:hypothetical protein
MSIPGGGRSWGESLGLLGHAVTTCLSNTAIRCQNIYHSTLGRKVRSSILENTAETAGSFASGPVASVLGKVTGNSLAIVGRASSLVGSAAIAAAGAHIIGKNLQAMNQSAMKSVIVALSFFLMLSSMIYLTATHLEQKGQQIGEELGQTVGALVGTIVGAYACIKLCGSEEVLWDSQQIVRCYTFKCLQNMALTETARYLGAIPEGPITGGVVEFLWGCVFFNLLDIKDLSISLFKGTALNQKLPMQINHEIVKDEALNQFYKSILGTGVQNPRPNLSVLLEGHPMLANPFTRKAVYEMQKELYALIYQKMDMKGLISQTATLLPKKTVVNITNEQITRAIVEAVNIYESFSPQSRQRLDLLNQKQKDLEVFFTEVDEQLDQTNPLKATFKGLQELYNTGEGGLSIASLAHKAVKGLYQLDQFAADAAHHLSECLSNHEEQLMGFNLMKPIDRGAAEKRLSDSLRSLSKLAILSLLKPQISAPEEKEMRTFYKSMTHILIDYYAQALGDKASGLAKGFMDFQLSHCELDQ